MAHVWKKTGALENGTPPRKRPKQKLLPRNKRFITISTSSHSHTKATRFTFIKPSSSWTFSCFLWLLVNENRVLLIQSARLGCPRLSSLFPRRTWRSSRPLLPKRSHTVVSPAFWKRYWNTIRVNTWMLLAWRWESPQRKNMKPNEIPSSSSNEPVRAATKVVVRWRTMGFR